MLNLRHLRALIIRPVLRDLDLYSVAAEELIVGTALKESGLYHLEQIGGGPALGIYQMEPETRKDIDDNYLAYRPGLYTKVIKYLSPHLHRDEQLVYNLKYATAMVRIHYRRVPKALPDKNDLVGMATYWKEYYNTPAGLGHPDEFIEDYLIGTDNGRH